jgi:hypothetical protein
MASNASRKRSKQHQTTLEEAKKRFNDSWDYQKTNWHDKWKRDNKLYNSERYLATYHGVTDTFVPLTFSTVETMVSALNNASLRFDYKSGDPLRQVSTAPLNSLVDEWWDDDQWDLAFEEGEREMFITGMAPFMLSWEGDRPHLHHGAMLDYVVDPTVAHPYELQEPGHYAGRRYLVMKGSLEDYEVVDTDPKSATYGEMIKRFKMPRNAGSNAPTGESTDKQEKELTAGSTLKSADSDQDEVIEIWDVDRVVTMLNRQDIIEDVENPYKARHRALLTKQFLEEGASQEEAEQQAYDQCQGLVPFFFFRNYRRSSLFYAKSEIDAIAKPQEYLNDMRNMSSDAIIKSLARQKELDPKYADWLDLINEDPETVYPFTPGSLRPIDPPRVDANSFNAEATTKQEMRETTALDQIMKGQSPTGDPTATQINAQVSQSSERIESKARILEKDGLYWMAHILFRMFQLYVTEPMIIEVKGSDAQGLKTTITLPDGSVRKLPEGTALLDPADYRGDGWKPKVTLEVDANAKKSEEQTAAKENYSIIIQDPTNNLEEAKRRLYPKMFDITKDDIDAITTPGQDQQAMLQGGMEGEGDMGGAMPEELPEELPPETPPEAPGAALPPDVDTETLASILTPEEWRQLQDALATGAPL